jgi:hypothetical protein
MQDAYFPSMETGTTIQQMQSVINVGTKDVCIKQKHKLGLFWQYV